MPDITVEWPQTVTPELQADVHRVIEAVSAIGGAIGWFEPAPRNETDAWLDSIMSHVPDRDAALCLTLVNGVVQGMGYWKRLDEPVLRNNALIGKIMAHPEARGLRLGFRVTHELIEDARAAGVEQVHLNARGNNHLAIELYRELGFIEWGRWPNALTVGNARFDSVAMCLELQRPLGVELRGSLPGGPGASPSKA